MLKSDEILKGLRRISTQGPADLRCLGCKYEDHCSIKGCAIIRETASLINDLLKIISDNSKTIENLEATVSSVRELVARYDKKG